MTHVRELREREKRLDSIIIRGFTTTSVNVVKDKFRDICRVLRLENIELCEVKKVGPTNLFRATIRDLDMRRELILRSHELARSENFSMVYINKDLTYQQRQELLARRRALRRDGEDYQGQRSSFDEDAHSRRTVVSNSNNHGNSGQSLGRGGAEESSRSFLNVGNAEYRGVSRGRGRGRGSAVNGDVARGRGSSRGRGFGGRGQGAEVGQRINGIHGLPSDAGSANTIRRSRSTVGHIPRVTRNLN